jgi:hypothetical protein
MAILRQLNEGQMKVVYEKRREGIVTEPAALGNERQWMESAKVEQTQQRNDSG